MKTWILRSHCTALLLFVAAIPMPAFAQTVQLASGLDSLQRLAAGGGGESGVPIISPDGRYVLFASTAANLSLTSSNTAFATRGVPTLNVFLRDRTNGTTALVSVNLAGTGGGNDNSLPVNLSTNGRYAAFESSASDLVAGDTNGVTDIFVRDLVKGTTILVTVSTNGDVGSGASRSAVMTPDGRYVAFVSEANNLVGGDTNGIPDVFVRDVQAGVTTLVSVKARRALTGSSSDAPDITPDGRYVVFSSTASNLVAGVVNAQDIYVRDLVGGNTVWASTGAGAAALSVLHASKVVSYNHAVSADGKFVAYEASAAPGSTPSYPGLILRYNLDSGATDLIHTNAAIQSPTFLDFFNLDMTPDGQRIVFVASTNGTSGATTCILLWDAGTDAITLVSGDLNNQVATNYNCDHPTIEPNGQFVGFSSTATNLTTNRLRGDWHLYLRDVQAGATTLLDADPNGVGSPIGALTMPCLSADGRFVAFEGNDGNLIPNDRNHASDVFVRDLVTGAVELITAHEPALASLTPNGSSWLSTCGVSADGNRVAFASDADNLVARDTNGFRDVFVRDQVNGTNMLVSVGTNGLGGDGASCEPAISADGRYVAFTSYADNLAAGDTNRASDVFVRDLQTGLTTLVSLNSSGVGSGNKDSYAPVIGAGGRYVMFRSKSSNLAPASFTGTENLFVRDLQAGTNYALTTGGLCCAAMTLDGRFVAFVDMSGAISGKLYVWASGSAAKVYTNSTSSIATVAISPDGNRLAYGVSSITRNLFAVNLVAGGSSTISTGWSAFRTGLHFSADNQFLAYAAKLNSTNQVYLYDFQGGTNILISQSSSPTAPGDNTSDSPDVSADGRFVAYRSTATNIVSGNTNGVPGIFLRDRQTGVTTLLSVSHRGQFAGNGRSLNPTFSADGRSLIFQTWASDLADADFNHSSDVLAYRLYPSGSIPIYSATIHPRNPTDPGSWISWQAAPGKSYRVQFKNRPDDPVWQELGGSMTILGNQGYCQDLAPAATRRFYRIVGY
jgi:Tol biopolymer transport system component